jgi:DNA-directed RNA polymerase specialized sigma24 family protein
MRRASRPPVSPNEETERKAATETAGVLARIICRCRRRALESDERNLVARCLAGDQRASVALVERYARMVGTVIWRTTGSQEDVADLTQETFLRVFRALPYAAQSQQNSQSGHTAASRTIRHPLRRSRSRGLAKGAATTSAGGRVLANHAATLLGVTLRVSSLDCARDDPEALEGSTGQACSSPVTRRTTAGVIALPASVLGQRPQRAGRGHSLRQAPQLPEHSPQLRTWPHRRA